MSRGKIQTARSGEAVRRSAEEQVFSNFVETHRLQILRFLLASSRDPDLAETLTQECFLKAYRNWMSFRGESSGMTWLMRIAINLQKDCWRSQRLRFWRHTSIHNVDPDEASDWLPSAESSPEARALACEQVGLVWRAIDKLCERQRTVFLLRFAEELTVTEIARATRHGRGHGQVTPLACTDNGARGSGWTRRSNEESGPPEQPANCRRTLTFNVVVSDIN